jgi:PiT family inorganic phosphate transporter
LTLFGATHFGIPVSTTHTITGAIIGVGATTRLSGIKWGVAERIVWAWLFTLPVAGLISAGAFLLMHHLLPAL